MKWGCTVGNCFCLSEEHGIFVTRRTRGRWDVFFEIIQEQDGTTSRHRSGALYIYRRGGVFVCAILARKYKTLKGVTRAATRYLVMLDATIRLGGRGESIKEQYL